MTTWLTGYTQAELDHAQERYGLTFPPDLVALLRDRRPSDGYDWVGDDELLCEALNWPMDSLRFSAEQGFLWLKRWGDEPGDPETALRHLARDLADAPRLIPLTGHRYLPATPCLNGNPVFSVYGADTILYGASLDEFWRNESDGDYVVSEPRHIPFWSEVVEAFESWGDEPMPITPRPF